MFGLNISWRRLVAIFVFMRLEMKLQLSQARSGLGPQTNSLQRSWCFELHLSIVMPLLSTTLNIHWHGRDACCAEV
jgi:hypothetical protein